MTSIYCISLMGEIPEVNYFSISNREFPNADSDKLKVQNPKNLLVIFKYEVYVWNFAEENFLTQF